jgi:glyoxylase-like metal-dependent hydrolase (beta-lactamase superfamily II)
MAAAQNPPPLNIPNSPKTVKVSIIETTSHMRNFPMWTFVEPLMAGHHEMEGGSYAFLVEHAKSGHKYDTLVFDLGVRLDWEKNSPPKFVEAIKKGFHHIKVEKDTSTILLENGVNLNDVGAIIWSHWHFDHTGNPGNFPGTTDLIVGPGFKANMLPGYPTVADSVIDERLWAGRELREIDFVREGNGLKIGKFNAVDLYGDGSFYLLNTPGHTIGHISALARTTAEPPTFIFMGGDIAHHGGEFRPTSYLPLPEDITPHPVKGPMFSCPGELFVAVHPKKSRTEPFFNPTTLPGSWHHSHQEATSTIDKLTEFDAYEHIFPVIAHDNSLLDVIDFYPKPANDWLAKGWKQKSFWGFLSDFTVDDIVK